MCLLLHFQKISCIFLQFLIVFWSSFVCLVPTGPQDTPTWLQRPWRNEAIDDFYKGKMPNWLTKDELAAASDKGCYYEVFLLNFLLHLVYSFFFFFLSS